MSFTYGGTDTATLAGVTATLEQWPSAGGLTVHGETVPGAGGRVFASSSMERTAFEFDVIIHGRTVEEVAQRRDIFMATVDPSLGPRDLILEADPDWKWTDVLLAEEILWDRYTWRVDLGYRLRGTVTFETQRKATAVQVKPTGYVGIRSVPFTLNVGTTMCFPRVDFESGPNRVVNIPGMRALTIEGAPSNYTAVLDWDAMEFYLADSEGRRVSSLVPYMSHFERPAFFPGQSVAVTVNANILVRVYINARRS